jgi:hypothetical protein
VFPIGALFSGALTALCLTACLEFVEGVRMRRGHIAFQITGSLLAILCAVSLAIVLGGCVAPAAEWKMQTAAAAKTDDLVRSELHSFALLTGVAIPLSRIEENAIIARAIAEHEMRKP